MTKVFIDGQAGTTGLQIFDMLRNRSDLEIITIPEDQRKIPAARKELLNSSEITIFCLPDDAATEASSFRESDTRIIDASTAHRVDDQWVYGLPELSENHRQKIRNAALVSNPGCYPQGFILLVKLSISLYTTLKLFQHLYTMCETCMSSMLLVTWFRI